MLFTGSTTTNSCVLPAVTRIFPSGLSANAWGRIPGNSRIRPVGVTNWLTGVMIRLVLLRITGSVMVNAAGDSCPRQMKTGAASTSDNTVRDKTFLVKRVIIGSKNLQTPKNPPSRIGSHRGLNGQRLAPELKSVIPG